MSKTALITGITGQDGPYLASLLLEKGYKVHGLRQPSAVSDLGRLDAVLPHIDLHYGDMVDGTSINNVIRQVNPDEIYNLAAQSHVHISFDTPEYTTQVNALGVLRLLETIRAFNPRIKFFQASTSELYGDALPPQNEATVMNPRSPYAAAKKYAYDMVRIYREAYGIFACNGIMFNHESPSRGEEFVTRKITMAVADIAKGSRSCLYLGNLNARRDWSHAADIMKGAWLMMQQQSPNDFILSSGNSSSVRDFASLAFVAAGIELRWEGSGTEEIGRNQKGGEVLVAVDPLLFRPLEVENLQGDSSKARKLLNWAPEKSLQDIVDEMVNAEMGCNINTDPKIHKLYG